MIVGLTIGFVAGAALGAWIAWRIRSRDVMSQQAFDKLYKEAGGK